MALYPLLTARENLQAFGRLQGLSGRVLGQQVDWVLERTGLTDRAAEPIKQFSGGMRRRLNIACGIVHRPRVVLLDEPTVGVDPQSRDRIYDVLAELRSDGVSLLLTTHHLEEAEARCSRTVIIDHGKVIASGTMPELVDLTVGRHRLVTLRMDRPLDAGRPVSRAAATWRAKAASSAPAASRSTPTDPRVVRARLKDVGVGAAAIARPPPPGRPIGRGSRRARPEPPGRVHSPHRKGAERMTPQADSARHRSGVLTLIGIAWTNLKRDRVAQAMTFLLPIIFFSIFATVFGNQGNPQTMRIRVAVVDEDQSELSRRMIEGMRKETGLRVRTSATEDAGGAALDRPAAERLVRSGDVPVAVVIPRGLGAAFGQTGFGGGPAIVLLADPSDPIAPNVVGGLLQKVTMTAAPDLMMQGGIRQFETYAGQLTPQQRAAVDAWMPS